MTDEKKGIAIDLVRDFLNLFATQANLSDEALDNTPRRFVEGFMELLGMDDEPWGFTTFDTTCDEMVICKDIEFVSLCEHHLLPIVGIAHVGYIPQGKIAGLSKLARVVKSTARGLWTQESLTVAVADRIARALEPKGVAVVMEAAHMCMNLRGVKTQGSRTTTSAMTGVFRTEGKGARAEFLGLIK